jgi:D-lactate dehydrogenase (cytochrome)
LTVDDAATPPNIDAILVALVAALGEEKLIREPAALELLSSDVSGVRRADPLLAIQPHNPQDVMTAVRVTADLGLDLGIRGGGMSYTQGYTPRSEGSVLLDVSRLNRVEEINTEDGYAVVEAGCTWQQLDAALAPAGMQSVLRGPISGSVSTIGGAVSQAIPGNQEGLLGVEVITGDGKRVTAGGAGLSGPTAAFFPQYGPDLIGLFVGDCGSYGVKTRLWLRLVPRPAGIAFGSFAFDTLADLVGAMVRVSRLGGQLRCFGMDPLKSQTATQVDIGEGIKTLWRVVRAAPNLRAGLADALRIVRAGRNVMQDVRWSLHLTAESYAASGALAQMADARRICAEHGREIEASVPRALHARPYSIRGFVGLEGERWLPVHGIFPFSRAAVVVQHVEGFFAKHGELLESHDIRHSFILSAVSGSHWLIEPMFYWRDVLTPLHLAHLSPRNRTRFAGAAADETARATVFALRRKLADLFDELGGVHVQLGKFYGYRERVDPGAYELATALKDVLDPENRLNRGNLGWGEPPVS